MSTQTISIRLGKKTKEAFKSICQEKEITSSEYLRQLILREIKVNKKE